MVAVGAEAETSATEQVVLASASPTRRRLLEAAGVPFVVRAAAVDESEVKQSLRAEGASAFQVAEALAEMKAMRVSAQVPGCLIIGADQMLACDGDWFEKPADLAAAARQLRRLSGRTHHLETSVCVVRDGVRIWHFNDIARLTMRRFDEAFVDSYLAEAGPTVLGSVGCYQLEGLGAQLFNKVSGDFFTILGLPLLPLLDFLRVHGVIRT